MTTSVKWKKEDLSPLCIIILFYYILLLDFDKSMNIWCFFVPNDIIAKDKLYTKIYYLRY